MDTRIELKKNDRLLFSDMECTIDHALGRGSNVIAYVGQYRDYKYPSITHRVLIRELFPYDPKGMISRNPDGSIHIENEALPLYELNRRTFEKGIEVHNLLLKENPSDIDLNINNYEYNNTLYSLVGYTGGRNLYEELGRAYWKDKKASGTEPLPHIIRIIKGALGVLQTFHRSGYLHLDISPDNILLIGEDEKERVTLIDYNSVHTIDEVRGRRSVYYSTKEGFTAPEVQNGRNGQIREWTDLYSITAVLYLCLTGKKLTSAQMVGVAPISIGPADSPFLKDCPETVLAMVRQILRKGLSVTAHRRYHSAAQMLVDMTELEDRIRGRGITHWALWEAGRERIRRSLKENPAMGYLLDEKKIYPLFAETPDGEKISLIQDIPDLRNTRESLPLSAENEDNYTKPARKISDLPAEHRAPLLLLGGGGTGKTTALFRIACSQNSRYHASSAVVYYISLYGYRDNDQNYICDRLLESLKFKPHTDNIESARRELIQLLDNPQRERKNAQNAVLPASDLHRAENNFLLLLDGLNEAAGDITSLLKEIHMLAGLSGVRIILTSRSDPGDSSFHKLSLCRLDQTEVRRILSEEGILPPENMEVLDLLSFPMMLSMYIRAVQNGEKQLRVESREQLLDDFFAAILEKEKRELPEDHAEYMGMEAAVRYLLPEIAALAMQKQRALNSQELLALAGNCYRELSRSAITTVYPEWIGRSSLLRCGAKTADEWYGKAVLEILWKRLGFLIRDEHGGFRIQHQMIEEYLADSSLQFHHKFDEVKRKQRNWGILCGIAVLFLVVASFGVYNYSMRTKISRQQQETLRNESLALSSSSEAELRKGDRPAALFDAYQALNSEETDRPYVEEAEHALTDALHVYETDRYHPVQIIKWSNEMLSCTVSSDGTFFVLLDEFGKLTCYDANTGNILWSHNTSARRNSSISSSDLNQEKSGYARNPEQRLPFLEIVEELNAVFCVGESEPGMLVSLSDGAVRWRFNEPVAKRKNDEQAEYIVESADLSSDRKSVILGICKTETDESPGGDGKENVSRYLAVYDMATGLCSASSGPIYPANTDSCRFTGKGAFSDQGSYYIVLRDHKTKCDRILCMDPQSGRVTDGPVISVPWTEEQKGVTELICRHRIYYGDGEHEGEIYQEEGVFYYSNQYVWNINSSYSGKAIVAFAANYGKKWTYSKEIELVGDADRFPSIIPYDNSIFLLSGNMAVCLDPQGEEKRVVYDKRAVCIGKTAEGIYGNTVFLINEDGTVDGFNLYTMQLLNSDFDSYTLIEEPLSGGILTGITPYSFCVFSKSEYHAAIICTYFEDNRTAGLENPTKDSSFILSGEFESLSNGDGFIFLNITSLGKDDEGHYKKSVYGSLYDVNGQIRDRIDFETVDDFMKTYSLRTSGDGNWLYNGYFLYNLEDHLQVPIRELPDDAPPSLPGNIISADTKDGILSAVWHDGALTLWKNGELWQTTAPDSIDHKNSLMLNQKSLNPFNSMIVSKSGLVILCGYQKPKKIETNRGNGLPVDHYLVYSAEEDRWTVIDNASEQKGFPMVEGAVYHPWFAALDENDQILIYDAETGNVIQKFDTDLDLRAVSDIKFILNDQYLAVLTASGSTRYEIIRIEDGATVYTYQPKETNLVHTTIEIQEDIPRNRIFIMSRDYGRTGVCISTENWTTKFEIPSLCCVLNDNTYVICKQQKELVKYPFFSLEELLSNAEETLTKHGLLSR